MKKVQRESWRYRLFRILFLLFFIAVFLLPIWWMIKTSIIVRTDTVLYPPQYLPSSIEFDGYIRIWQDQGLGILYFNTIRINIMAALLALLLGIPAAYAASRYEFWGKEGGFMFTILSTRFLPPATALVPIFFLYKYLGLVDSIWGLVVAYAGLNLPIVVWVMRSFIDEIPMFMICNFLTWGEFLLSAVLTPTVPNQTLPIGAAQLEGDIGILWQQIAAIGVLGAIPITLIIIFFQRYLVRGFSFGILK